MEKDIHNNHQDEPNAEPMVLTDEEKKKLEEKKREEEIKANEKNIETNSHK